ncbi:hypothetical protein BD626DRAFT_65439 [Schizophyllum amplum]|uniref:MYND-type domain-containing protein n=1 Tax=Schizophyllum amplum TaxID=97359 RepID=A0A550CAY5_9AGAR|nr:hypothetical protein BD626DRAFT_65439 [Auriculariopsis ampla]
MAAPKFQELKLLHDRLEKTVSAPARRVLSNQIKTLIVEPESLALLSKDPFMLPEGVQQSGLDVSEVINNLSFVIVLLDFTEHDDRGDLRLADSALQRIRQIWYQLVAWIEYIHPPTLATYSRMWIPPYVLGGLLCAIFRTKARLADQLAQTSQVYRIFIDLWLQSLTYAGEPVLSKTTLTAFDNLANAVPFVFSIEGQPPSCIDPFAKEEALTLVRHRVGDLYKLATSCLQQCVRCNDPASKQSTFDQISAMRYLVVRVLPMTCFPRAVVRTIVYVARVLSTRPDELDSANSACRLVEDIWEKATDDRSIIWALRDGILPVIVALNRNDELTPTIKIVVKRAIYLPVARALAALPERVDLRNAGINPEMANSAHEELIDRISFAIWLDRKICANSACPDRHSDVEQRYRRCACFQVHYCSKSCQVADWPVHKALCNRGTLFEIVEVEEKPDIRPLHAFFTCLAIDSYFYRVGQGIMAEMEDMLREVSCPVTFSVGLDFSLFSPPLHPGKIRAHRYRSEGDEAESYEATVTAIAHLGRLRGVMVAVKTKRWSLSQFRQITETLPTYRWRGHHFREMVDSWLAG